MKTYWVPSEFRYDGTQLRSLYAYLEHGVLGDSIVSWIGPCDVAFDHMVDGEDLLARAEIRGSRMVHFITEKFDCSLFAAVALQRLMASICMAVVRELSPQAEISNQLVRKGDDLFFNDQKLNISIATLSPTSALIHFAVNVSNAGTPVRTLCLEDLEIEPKEFAIELMQRVAAEVNEIIQATQKVRWVR